MIAASMVSRNTMKKIGTEKRLRVMVDGEEGGERVVQRFKWSKEA